MSARFLQINTPLGQNNTHLTDLSGREELGRLPEYHLTLVARKAGIQAEELLGKNITVGMEMPGGLDVRFFNGYVTQFADAGVVSAAYFEEGGQGRAYAYHLTMHPWLWFLTRRTDCRIFQDMTVPDIIKQIFREYPFAQFEEKLTGSYSPREYCCQYRESDFNFVSRLMEQEGIYYHFTHDNGAHTLVLCDAAASHQARPGYGTIPFSELASPHGDRECITQWHVSHAVQPGRYTLNDFDFKKPKADLVSKSTLTGQHDLNNFELYDYPGAYTSRNDGEDYARVRIEELHSQFEVISAAGDVRGIQTGSTFKLTEHRLAVRNREYLVIGANFNIANNAPGTGSGSGASFHCSFRAINSDTPFHTTRTTPKPVVQGPQTAIVVGKAGEEIWVDQHGRVKVMFHWDRRAEANEKSSCWVRVSQPWAGKSWGAVFLPRIGQEVIVDFLEGDPDSPVVTGRVYNADCTPHWPLPDQKTRSGFITQSSKGGAGYNALRFEDKAGSEQIFIHAEKNYDTRVKNDRLEWVGHESHHIVKKDQKEKISEGEHHLTVHGNQNVKLEDGGYSLKAAKDWQGKMGGKILAEAGAEIHLKAGAGMFVNAASSISTQTGAEYLLAADKDISLSTQGNLSSEATKNVYLKGMQVVIEASMGLTLKMGGNFITLDPSGIAISGKPFVQINSAGSALSGSPGPSPKSGTPCMPTAPKKPNAADDDKPGQVSAPPSKPTPPENYSPQAQSLKLAWERALPFVVIA